MNNIITQRFIKCHEKLREENRIRSSRQFAIALDYLPQSLSEILKGRRDVTIELIRKAVDLFKVNPVYLFVGEGPMFMTEQSHPDFRVLTIVTNVEEEERIVHVPVPAQAGCSNDIGNPTFIQELPTFSLPDFKYKTGTHRCFDVAGDSMESSLFEGDKVVCSYLEPILWESAIKDNYVYVIVTKGDIVVKRVINKLRDEKLLELHSDNSFYERYKIGVSDIREIWQVRTKISPFLPSMQKNNTQLLHEELTELKQIIREQSRLIEALYARVQK